jgi:acetolactate synthase II small subunit
MRYQLDLTLRQAEGALARVLGTAERRGFRPLAVDGEAQVDGDRWHLRLTVESDRDDTNLQAQLAKLHDCLAVEVSPCS